MKHFTVVLAFVLSGCTINYSESGKENAAAIDQAITAIKIALGIVEADLQNSSIQLANAELTLNTSHIETIDGKGEVLLVHATGGKSQDSGGKVIIKLIPAYNKTRPRTQNVSEDIGR